MPYFGTLCCLWVLSHTKKPCCSCCCCSHEECLTLLARRSLVALVVARTKKPCCSCCCCCSHEEALSLSLLLLLARRSLGVVTFTSQIQSAWRSGSHFLFDGHGDVARVCFPCRAFAPVRLSLVCLVSFSFLLSLPASGWNSTPRTDASHRPVSKAFSWSTQLQRLGP